MPLRTTEAFVLRTYSLAEAHKICVLLTRDYGKVRGVAYGARKLKSRFGSALEPLTQVALTFFEKEGRELVSISTCDILLSHFASASRNVETASAFSYISELLTEFLPEHEPNERVYRLVSAILDAIDEGRGLNQLLRYFEAWLLKLVGFFPDISSCSVCGTSITNGGSLYLTASGEPQCSGCSQARGTPVSPALADTIRAILRLRPAAFTEISTGRQQLDQLREINYLIIRHALERDLRSHTLLKQLNA